MFEHQSTETSYDDKDLVQLAGYHAYKYYKVDDEIKVNGGGALANRVAVD